MKNTLNKIKKKLLEKNYANALDDINLNISLNPDNFELLLLGSKCLFELKKYFEATQYLDRIDYKNKININVLMAYFSCYKKLKNLEELVQIFIQISDNKDNIKRSKKLAKEVIEVILSDNLYEIDLNDFTLIIINYIEKNYFEKEFYENLNKYFNIVQNLINEDIEKDLFKNLLILNNDFHENIIISEQYFEKNFKLNENKEILKFFLSFDNISANYYLSKIGIFNEKSFFKEVEKYYEKDNQNVEIINYIANIKQQLLDLNKNGIYYLDDYQKNVLDKINYKPNIINDNKLMSFFINLNEKDLNNLKFNEFIKFIQPDNFYDNLMIYKDQNNFIFNKQFIDNHIDSKIFSKNIIYNFIKILPNLYNNDYSKLNKIIEIIKENYKLNNEELSLIDYFITKEFKEIDIKLVNKIFNNILHFIYNNYILSSKKFELNNILQNSELDVIKLNYITIRIIKNEYDIQLYNKFEESFNPNNISLIKIKLMLLENINVNKKDKKILKFLKEKEQLLENKLWYYIYLYKKLLNCNKLLECMNTIEKFLNSNFETVEKESNEYSILQDKKINHIILNKLFFTDINLNEEKYKAKFILGSLYKYFGKYANSLNLFDSILNESNLKEDLIELNKNEIKNELNDLILNKNLVFHDKKIINNNDIIILNEVLMIKSIKYEFKEVFGLIKILKDCDFINYLSILYIIKDYGTYLKNSKNLNENYKNCFSKIINKIKLSDLNDEIKELMLIINILLELNINFEEEFYPKDSFLNKNNNQNIYNDKRKIIYEVIQEKDLVIKKNYLDILIKFYPNDMKLWVLYGNLLLVCEKPVGSIKCFEIAYNLLDLSNNEEIKILILNLNLLKNKYKNKKEIQNKSNKILKMLNTSFLSINKNIKDLELLKSNIKTAFDNKDYKESISLFKLLLIQSIKNKNYSIILYLEEDFNKIVKNLNKINITTKDLKEIYYIINQNQELFNSDFIKKNYLLNLKIILNLVELYGIDLNVWINNYIKNPNFIKNIIQINNYLKDNDLNKCKKLLKISLRKYPILFKFCLSINNLILNKEKNMLKNYNIDKLIIPKTKNNFVSLNYKINIDSTFKSLNRNIKLYIKRYPENSIKIKKLIDNFKVHKLKNINFEEIKLKYSNDNKISNLINDIICDKKNKINDNVIDTSSYIINLSKNFNTMKEEEFEEYLQSLSEIRMNTKEEIYVNYYVFLFYLRYFDKEDEEKVIMLNQVYEYLLENENISKDFQIEMTYLKQIYKRFILNEFNKRKYNKILKLCFKRNPKKYLGILKLLNN